MNFGEMLETLKSEPGSVARRTGWNGRGMAITLMPSLSLNYSDIRDHTMNVLRTIDRMNRGVVGAPWAVKQHEPLKVEPYFAMFTAQGTWLPGWLASQTDIVADDWEVHVPAVPPTST